MRYTIRAVLLATAIATAVPAQAADFSFSGMFTGDDDVAFFDFSATDASTITLRSYSYAGGTNAAGTVFAAGGFDPILTLYNLTTGERIAQQDDGSGVPSDPTTSENYDVNFSQILTAGNYRVALSQFDNFGGATLSDPFRRAGQGNFTSGFCGEGNAAPFCDVTGAKRTGNWAFDVLGVNAATGPGTPAVPEPATWAMMLLGFGMVAGAARYRRRSATVSFT